MTPGEWAAIVTAIGVPVVLRELLSTFRSWRTGRMAERRRQVDATLDRITRAEAAAERARQAADREATYRRLIAEHASQVRAVALAHGVPLDTLPPWPPHPPGGDPQP